MNLLFTICGRAGSKGVANKNCRPFLGTPIVHYTLSAIELFIKKEGKRFERIDICLSTDCKDLISQVVKHSANVVVLNRCESLSNDTAAKIDVIRDAAIFSERCLQTAYDYILDLDITSPLRTVTDILNCLTTAIQTPASEVVFSVTPARRNPYFNMVKEDGDFYTQVIKTPFTARQQAPAIFDMNASIYVYQRDFLINTKNIKLLEANCSISTMLDTGILDIDSEHDLELMQVIAKHLFGQENGFRDIYLNIKK